MTDDREVRNLLESTQAELGQARRRLEVLEQQSTDALEDRIDALEADNVAMRARLEQGDTVRESWAYRQANLERDLAIARTEQQRLQSRLETVALERKLTGQRGGSVRRDLVIAGTSVAVTVLLALLMLLRAG